MMRILCAWIFFAGVCFGQNPVALRTSDPKFTPRWVDVPAPTQALGFGRRAVGYTGGIRTAGVYEVAYALVDEAWAISPVSPAVTISPTTSDWDCIGTTPNVPLWTRATGILWVWRQAGTTTWKPFASDVNKGTPASALKPFKPITGWGHTYGGHWLYASAFPDLSNTALYPSSKVLTTAPPVPAIRLLECPNYKYDVAMSWTCNQGETALSPVLAVPAVKDTPTTRHAPMSLIRMTGANPPQGALGAYVYMRKPGGPWHRQPCPDGLTGDLWALDVVVLYLNQFVESNIPPGPVIGKSYLSSLHLALRDWSRDIIVDNDVTICCPLISEWSGATWDYQPRNHWVASYGVTNGTGTWTLTVDGVTSAPMVRTANFGNAWQQWQPTLDAAFGVGNVAISDFWALFAPKIELTGKWAATNMAGKVSVEVKDANGVVVDPWVVGTIVGQGWAMSNADTKFKRKISTSNAGNWKVQDTATAPDNVTGYPMGWPMWVEFSQRTKLVGCDFLMVHSNCGVATCDNNGGGCFHFNPVECSAAPHFTNTRPVTFGFRCVDSSGWGYGGHLCSELVMEKCHLQGKFPLVCEGQQAANWQIRDGNFHADGTFDSAIITQANAGAITCGGRFTCDNARTMWACVWAQKLTIDNLWLDQGMPALTTYSANSWGRLTINGGKINHWNGWLHAIESPAGSVEPYIQKLITDNVDSQQNGSVDVRVCNPKAGQAIYAPRVPAEVPSIFASIMP